MNATHRHLVMARVELQAALIAAEQDRDRAVFEVKAGRRCPVHSIKSVERVGLIRAQLGIMDQLLPAVPAQEQEAASVPA